VLLTGARGAIGRVVAARLQRDGWDVRAFDLVDGDDLRNPDAVLAAARGCRAIVHAGAVPHDSKGTPPDILVTNVLGTWHVLLAAEREQVDRVVSFSSVQVFGCSDGEGVPERLPIDDDTPRRASRPYGSSKRLGEDLCEEWSARTHIPTVALRPVATYTEEQFAHIDLDRAEWGGYVHVDDVADAVALALGAPVGAHTRLLLSTGGDVDATRAREVLGWEPVRIAHRRGWVRRLARRVRHEGRGLLRPGR
jgi:nucleoside-diphosphate-sugar epimerase